MKLEHALYGFLVLGTVFLVGVLTGYTMLHNEYAKCRYYGQSIEFCAKEIGWEKK